MNDKKIRKILREHYKFGRWVRIGEIDYHKAEFVVIVGGNRICEDGDCMAIYPFPISLKRELKLRAILETN
jgi:hypothetical protein